MVLEWIWKTIFDLSLRDDLGSFAVGLRAGFEPLVKRSVEFGPLGGRHLVVQGDAGFGGFFRLLDESGEEGFERDVIGFGKKGGGWWGSGFCVFHVKSGEVLKRREFRIFHQFLEIFVYEGPSAPLLPLERARNGA